MIYLELLIRFLKVGLLSFGGAYGAIALISDIVLDYGWLSEEMLTYMIAVSESTPGPIMVNLATYIGSSQAGLLGAIIATFAVVFPSFVVILFAKELLKLPLFKKALKGLKPCVIGIVLATGLKMMFKNIVDLKAAIIISILIVVMILYKRKSGKKLPPISLILVSCLLGMIIY